MFIAVCWRYKIVSRSQSADVAKIVVEGEE